jgi:PAS domain S-box-containing protein
MTALELAEKLAEDRERIDKALVQNCPIPVFNTEKDGKWQAVNEPFKRLLALSAFEPLLGSRWQKLLVESEAHRIKQEWAALLDSESTKGCIHFNFKAADGRVVQAEASMIKLDGGRWLGFMVPICDNPNDTCPLHRYLLRSVA